MFRKIFNFDYSFQEMQLFLENALISSLAAGVIIPLLLFRLTYHAIDHTTLAVWLFLEIFVFTFRAYVIQKLKILLRDKQKEAISYFRVLVGLLFLNAALTLYLFYINLLEGSDQSIIFIFSVVIVTIAAGSIATLLSVFNIYFYFVLFNMLPLIFGLLFLGGAPFYLYAFILAVFSAVALQVGYKQHLLIKNIVALNETFQTIYETSKEGIFLLDKNHLEDCNQMVVDIFGYNSKEELLKMPIGNFIPKHQADGTLSIKKMLKMVKIVQEKGYHTFEWQYIRKNGELFWVDFVLTKVYINGKELLHAAFRDITKKKELQQIQEEFHQKLLEQVELEVAKNRKKDKMIMYQSRLAQMGEMINMIAHQWRQPLNAITATTTAITVKAKMGKLDTKTTLELTDKITQFAFHLSDTIDDFRNFFKSNKEKTTTTYEKLMQSVLMIVESSLKNHHITLHIEKKEVIEFQTYENEIKQVLLNLIKNAEDALLDKKVKDPYIKVIIDRYTIDVCDNAGGIDDKIMEKIFDPYFSTKKDKNGTGLGLYMSKTIVEDHCNGKLCVYNGDEGACFSVVLGEK